MEEKWYIKSEKNRKEKRKGREKKIKTEVEGYFGRKGDVRKQKGYAERTRGVFFIKLPYQISV